ncbi:MAG: GTP-binding protein [Candidatus Lokiarchaeota archaeon]|nr:GTP-binding protein [Candidatus Lokiarchaeota archaeon]
MTLEEDQNLDEEIDEREIDVMFKICIFGDGGVGKTTLLGRYLTGIFKSSTTMTIGVDFHVKKLEVDGKKILLQIWDFAGENRFRFLLPSYVLGASGGIFMYDITRYSSLKNFPEWINIFKNGYIGAKDKPLPVIMVGGKLDLSFKRAVPTEEAFDLAKNHKLHGYIECSAKDGRNIEDIFNEIAKLMLLRAGL